MAGCGLTRYQAYFAAASWSAGICSPQSCSSLSRNANESLPMSTRNVGAGIGPLMRAGTDHRGQLRIDQRLVDRPGSRADPFLDACVLEFLEQLEQGRLIQGHRVFVSFRENHWRGLTDRHTMAPPTWSPTPTGP